MSAAAVATSAALAMSPVEAGATDTARAMTDGATPVASQVAAVTPVPGVTTTISPPISLDGKLFYGTAATGGGELWESDGTPAGTHMIKQIVGKSDAAPADLTNVGGHLWFEADGELWKSSGTAASTVAIDTRVDPTAIVDAGSTVFIETAGGLWKSKGTPRTTTEVKAIKLGTKPDIVAVSGRLYFTDPGSAHNYDSADLWTSNGTPVGTTPVLQADVESGYAKYPRLYGPDDLTNVGGHLFFTASTNLVEASYTDLWEASGAKARQIVPYGYDLTNVAGSLYFFDFEKPHNCNDEAAATGGAECTASTGFALWKGTKPLFNFDPSVKVGYVYSETYAPYVGELTAVGSTLFFATNLGGSTQLWRDDGGTDAGMADVGPLAPHDLTNVNGTLFFTGNEASNPSQVYESNGEAPAQNGTDAGTFAVTSFPATTTTPGDLINLGGTLYFTANDGSAGGYGLWTLSTGSP